MSVTETGPTFADVAMTSSRGRRILRSVGYLALLAVLAYLVVLPLGLLQFEALGDGAHGYRIAYGSPRIGGTVVSTLEMTIGSVVLALVLGTSLAWSASRLPVAYQWLRSVPVLPLVVPPVAGIIGWILMLAPGPGYLNALLRSLPWWSDLASGPVDIYTMRWIIILTALRLSGFVYLFVSAGLQNLNQDYLEAARVSGSSSVGTFFRVVLPLIRPSLVYASAICFLLAMGNFTAPLLLGTNSGIRVITTELFVSMAQSPVDYGVAAAFASPLLIAGLILIFVQRVIIGDRSKYATHSGKSFRPTTRKSRSSVAIIASYGILTTVLPLIALTIIALSPYWSGSLSLTQFSLANFRASLDEPAIWSSVWTSITVSGIAVALLLPLGFIGASVLLRGSSHKVVRAIIDLVVSLPLSIPAVVFGAAFLLTYVRPPFILYGTPWVIVLVYVTIMLPFAVRSMLAALMSLGDQYRESSRVSGAGFLRTEWRIVIPLVRSSFGAAAALIFILLSHEFAASVLVRDPFTQVMGTVLYDYWTNGEFPMVGVIGLLMTLVTGSGVALALRFGGGDALNRL